LSANRGLFPFESGLQIVCRGIPGLPGRMALHRKSGRASVGVTVILDGASSETYGPRCLLCCRRGLESPTAAALTLAEQ
jgi:hypothetical protein